jgi:hypothetical protein
MVLPPKAENALAEKQKEKHFLDGKKVLQGWNVLGL